MKFNLKSALSSTFLAIFLAGSVAAPVRLAAQEAAPQTIQVAQPDPSATKSVKYQKEESEDVFRHTKLVESLGKALNLDVETTARLFEWINFAIIFLAIILPLAKILPKTLRKRQDALNQHLEEARKTTSDANTRLSAVEAQLSRLDDEIAKVRAQVEGEIAQDEARIKVSLTEESARIVASAEQEISQAAAQAQREIKAFAADLAIDQAVKQLTLTAESDRALIDEFVAEASRGGKS